MLSSFKLLSATLLLTVTLSNAMESPKATIVPYEHERDYPAVKAIMEADSEYLLYPGQPLEYTARYLTSEKYKTDVIRINAVTVGFVNYCVYDAKILWIFNLGRTGVLHLLGIQKEHRRNGYAKKLAEHVIEYAKQEHAIKIMIQAASENDGAHKLYEKLGFQRMGPMLTLEL